MNRICFCNDDSEVKIFNSFNLCLSSNIKLNDLIKIYYCKKCNFYFSSNGNSQIEYNNYYTTINRYSVPTAHFSDKDQKTYKYITQNIEHTNTSILDYGAGNGKLAELLLKSFNNVNTYNIGYEKFFIKYDLLILSHVLEHIYDLNTFIKNISQNVNDNGLLYIEVPNAEYYKDLSSGPLQKINIEHINFFSKFALNKLLLTHNYYAINIIDDFFMLNNSKYYIIRCLFRKNSKNTSFEAYYNNGIQTINSFRFEQLSIFPKIYVYGCGELLFKLIKNIQKYTNVCNIIDDSECYKDAFVDTIKIINFDTVEKIIQEGDTVLITTYIHKKPISEKLLKLNKNLNLLSLDTL
jgi:hypothetical protein